MINRIGPLCRLCQQENIVTPAPAKWDGLCARHWQRERSFGRDPKSVAESVEVPDFIPDWVMEEL